MSVNRTVLLIDDSEATRETIAEVLQDASHSVCLAENVAQAVAQLEERSFDLVMTDLKLPDGTGMDVLEKSRQLHPTTPVIMITGHGSIENAIKATRLGAYEYLTKPVDLERIRVVVRNALHLVEVERKVVHSEAVDALVGQSEGIAQVKDLIRQIAHTDVSVLIQGESGTGKELVANAIQALSARKGAPFVKVNVAALSKNLIESELFGHEKGAFSGAIRQRKGRFELADTGTFFLDEIGEMRQELQVKLLRVLQEKELERVGGSDTLPIDMRLIAATNRNLKEMVTAGEFREDLYFRINVVQIKVPPLRERRDDIELLADHFLRKFSARYDVEKDFSAQTLSALIAYDWPGNVRELENAVEGALVRTPGNVIELSELPEDISGVPASSSTSGGYPTALPLEEIERRYILSELGRLNGKKTATAKSLGIGTKTLYRKLESYGVEDEKS